MKVVFSGISSMSGAMIARELLLRDVSIVGLARTPLRLQSEIVSKRLLDIEDSISWIENVTHGSEAMVQSLSQAKADTFVIHAHPMEGFKSQEYDLGSVINEMTSNLHNEIKSFANAGGQRVIYSGSVFEPNTQLGTAPNVAASRYGISKAVVWESLRRECDIIGVSLSRVTIPNPFGVGEIGRFGNYLSGEWNLGKTPIVKTPDYIRDNIHVRELAIRYADFVTENCFDSQNLRPSGYIESQIGFAQRMALEFSARSGKTFRVGSERQLDFIEPLVLINDGSKSNSFAEKESYYWDEYFSSYFFNIL
jgi:nucleoside-diphosphate-sugar epimerase